MDGSKNAAGNAVGTDAALDGPSSREPVLLARTAAASSRSGADTGGHPPTAASASAAAAASAGSNPPLRSPHQQQQTVSWDEDPRPPSVGGGMMLQQHSAANGPPSVAAKPSHQSPNNRPSERQNGGCSDGGFIGLASAGESPHPAASSDRPELGPPKKTNRWKAVKLDDVLNLNPLESEAETLIMKAIEKQEGNNRARTGSGSASLLGNVPADSVRVFGSPTSEGEQDGGGGGGDDQKSQASPAANGRAAAKKQQQQQQQQQNKKIPKPIHKRNLTTEQTLATLTMTMAAFQGEGGSGSDTSIARGRSGQRAVDAKVQSAAEAFARNADVVFRATKNRPPPKNNKGGSGGNHPIAGPSALSSSGGAAAAAGSGAVTTGAAADQGGTAGSNGTAAKRWGKVRNTVRVTGALGRVETPSGSAVVEVHNKTGGANDQVGDGQEEEDEETGVPDGHLVDETNHDNGGFSDGSFGGVSKRQGRKNHLRKTMVASKGAVQDFQVFVVQRRGSFFSYVRYLLMVAIPATAVAFILFYLTGNPPTGTVDVGNPGNGNDQLKASSSWWILFVCVRQALTFSAAQLIQVFIIDFLCLNTRLFVNLFGNLLTLLIIQSKGWPFIALTWGLLDFALLHGSSKFASHWLYWQSEIDIFNEANPGGSVTSNIWNTRTLTVAICVGVAVSIKRLWLGLSHGKKTYANHAEDLTKVVKKAVLLCEVATLAREFQLKPAGDGEVLPDPSASMFGMSKEQFDEILSRNMQMNEVSATEGEAGNDSGYEGELIIDSRDSDLRRGDLDRSQIMKISELLGAWEEPEAGGGAEENVSISGILQFRNSLSILDNKYMFSIAWGDVSTRDRMIVSSQVVYKRLLLRSSDQNQLNFDVLARVAEQQDGTLDQDKLQGLIRLLRPDRDGKLSMLEFIKSVDVVYKEAKLLRASVKNSEKIDQAFEKVLNILFYTVMVFIILSQVGYNPLTLFLSLSALIVGFAFMIGSASSKMFEGWLFILVRRPYNIGDRIHISNVECDTDPNGSSGWLVKDVTLFHTTVVYGSTGEVATLSNGSLAASRVINMARSPHASASVDLKFSTSVPYEKIQLFEEALREFVKARPREWAKFCGFRAQQIYADLGYIAYVAVFVHRESWQNVVSILESKAQVSSFCLELSKKLDMRYQSPPLPVDLAFVKRGHDQAYNESLAAKFAGIGTDNSSGIEERAALIDMKK